MTVPYSHNENSLMPLMTANNYPSPVVITPSTEYSTPLYAAFHLCDRNSGTRWFAANGITTGYIIIYTGGPYWSVTSYTVTGCDSVGSCTPKDWTMLGSNDGTSWTLLHTVTGETGWTTADMRTYNINLDFGFSYYKMNITANDGYVGLMGFSQLELIGTLYTTPTLYIPFRGRDRFLNYI